MSVNKRRQGANNRRRGIKFEREIVNLAKKHNLHSQRTWSSDGRSQLIDPNVDVVINGHIHMQCKRQKVKVSEGYLPDENIFAQAIRGDLQDPHVVLRADDFFRLIAAVEQTKPDEP